MFDSKIPNNDMRKMPLALDFRDPDLLIQLSRTNAEIATLNEVAKTIPNQNILLEFLSIKEAVNSNEVENINTTISDAFQAELEENKKRIKKEDKETLHYKDALKF
jgi:Fic family protein